MATRRFHEGLANVIYFRNKKAPNQVTGQFISSSQACNSFTELHSGRLVKDFLDEKKRPQLLLVLQRLGVFDVTMEDGREVSAVWRELDAMELEKYR